MRLKKFKENSIQEILAVEPDAKIADDMGTPQTAVCRVRDGSN